MKRIVMAISTLLLESVISVNAMDPDVVVQRAHSQIDKAMSQMCCDIENDVVVQGNNFEFPYYADVYEKYARHIIPQDFCAHLNVREHIAFHVTQYFINIYSQLAEKHMPGFNDVYKQLNDVYNQLVEKHMPVCDDVYNQLVEKHMPDGIVQKNSFETCKVHFLLDRALNNRDLQSVLSTKILENYSFSMEWWWYLEEIDSLENMLIFVSLFTYDYNDKSKVKKKVYDRNFDEMIDCFSCVWELLPEFAMVCRNKTKDILYYDSLAFSNLIGFFYAMNSESCYAYSDLFNKFIAGYKLDHIMALLNHSDYNDSLAKNFLCFLYEYSDTYFDTMHIALGIDEIRNVLAAFLYSIHSEENILQMERLLIMVHSVQEGSLKFRHNMHHDFFRSLSNLALKDPGSLTIETCCKWIQYNISIIPNNVDWGFTVSF